MAIQDDPLNRREFGWPPFRVDAATPSDAGAILNITRAAFRPEYLAFSVYRSHSAVRFLRECIALGDGGGLRARVARLGDDVAGYTLADVRPGSFHLTYIASSPSHTTRGVGSLLLRDLLYAAAAARASASLDVFASNRNALAWYERHGFRVTGRSWSVEIQLSSVQPTSPARCDALAFEEALAEEATRGFSRIAIEAEGRTMLIGLLDGTVARVLESGGQTDVNVARHVRATFPDREALFLLGRPAVPLDLPVMRSEESIRMEIARHHER